MGASQPRPRVSSGFSSALWGHGLLLPEGGRGGDDLRQGLVETGHLSVLATRKQQAKKPGAIKKKKGPKA